MTTKSEAITNLVGHCLEFLGRAGSQEDVESRFGKLEREFAPNPVRGTGHDYPTPRLSEDVKDSANPSGSSPAHRPFVAPNFLSWESKGRRTEARCSAELSDVDLRWCRGERMSAQGGAHSLQPATRQRSRREGRMPERDWDTVSLWGVKVVNNGGLCDTQTLFLTNGISVCVNSFHSTI